MKVHLKVKDEKEVLRKLERANELLKELGEIFQGYSGLGRGIEVEVVPAYEDTQAQKINCSQEKK